MPPDVIMAVIFAILSVFFLGLGAAILRLYRSDAKRRPVTDTTLWFCGYVGGPFFMVYSLLLAGAAFTTHFYAAGATFALCGIVVVVNWRRYQKMLGQ